MNKVISELLKELREVCKQENIPFYLGGELAYRTSNNIEFDEDFCFPTVHVFAKDAKRLIEAIEKRDLKNRSVESLHNNKDFPGLYIRYSNTNTTYIDFEHHKKGFINNCIGINIQLVSYGNKGGAKYKIYSILRKMFLLSCKIDDGKVKKVKKMSSNGIKKVIIGLATKTFFKIFGTKSGMRKLFYAWNNMGKAESDFVAINFANYKDVKFKAAAFSGAMFFFLDGEIYRRPSDYRYTELLFRKRGLLTPEKKAVQQEEAEAETEVEVKPDLPVFKKRDSVVWMENVPYTEYDKMLEKHSYSLKKFKETNVKYGKWKRDNFDKYLILRRKYYNYMFATGDRFRLWKEFNPEKIALVKVLFEMGYYDECYELLEEYITLLKEYRRHKITLYFNRDMFLIALKLMIRESLKPGNGVPAKKRMAWMKMYITPIINDLKLKQLDPPGRIIDKKRSSEKSLKTAKKRIRANITNYIKKMHYLPNRQFKLKKVPKLQAEYNAVASIKTCRRRKRTKASVVTCGRRTRISDIAYRRKARNTGNICKARRTRTAGKTQKARWTKAYAKRRIA